MLGCRSWGREQKERCWEWKAERAFMQCPMSDKETINGIVLVGGIRSTHAWLLFQLIKGSFFCEARFTSTTKPVEKEAGNSPGHFALLANLQHTVILSSGWNLINGKKFNQRSDLSWPFIPTILMQYVQDTKIFLPHLQVRCGHKWIMWCKLQYLSCSAGSFKLELKRVEDWYNFSFLFLQVLLFRLLISFPLTPHSHTDVRDCYGRKPSVLANTSIRSQTLLTNSRSNLGFSVRKEGTTTLPMS